jgi:hypothetical protein
MTDPGCDCPYAEHADSSRWPTGDHSEGPLSGAPANLPSRPSTAVDGGLLSGNGPMQCGALTPLLP